MKSETFYYMDLIRFAFVAMAVVLLGVTGKVVVTYYRAYKVATARGDARGILPMYVWLISLSYNILLVGQMFHHLIELGSLPDFHIAISGLALPLGVVALLTIFRFESRRVQQGELPDRRSVQRNEQDDG